MSRDQTMPVVDLLELIGNDTQLSAKAHDEYHGPCPKCGGTDRLTVNTADGWWFCRQCQPKHGDAAGYLMWRDAITLPEAKRLLGTWCGTADTQARAATARPVSSADYVYATEDGTPLFKVTRTNMSNGDKKIAQRRYENGAYVKGLDAKDKDGKVLVRTRRVLFHLPNLTTAENDQAVYIAEGEKCVLAVEAAGLLATCNPGGTGMGWLAEYNESLRGRDVVILSDCDEPGRKHAQKIVTAVHGIAARLRVVDLAPDRADGFDVADWLAEGHTAMELGALADAAPAWERQAPSPKEQPAEMLDFAPASVCRPLCLVDGHGYAVTWVHLDNGQRACLVVRDDGETFSEAKIAVVNDLDELGLTVHFAEAESPPDSRIWSGAGVRRYQKGERPNPATVFARLIDVVGTFLDFERGLAPQQQMAEMIACYVMASYLLDAFDVAGYLWANGQMGSGKTNLLVVITELGYLGQLILSGGTYASLRDLADWGAVLGFDEAEEIMDTKRSDPEKRSLLLAGNRRGASVTVKEPAGPRTWRTRHVNVYSPRVYSAIKRPFGPLASRSIVIPMVRSTRDIPDDPTNYDAWPHDRRRVIDDLWALGLANVAALRPYDRKAASRATLIGRDLEPWRAMLAVALWLQEAHGVGGIFDRLHALAKTYPGERTTLEYDNVTRVAMAALLDLYMSKGQPALLKFTTAEATEAMNARATRDELGSGEEPYTNAKKTGGLLASLRLTKDDSATARGWQTSRASLLGMAKSYGMHRETVTLHNETSLPSRTSQTSSSTNPAGHSGTNHDVYDVSDVDDVIKGSVVEAARAMWEAAV